MLRPAQNVLLFLVKLVINRQTDFRPFAARFADPLIMLACADGCNGGHGLHYFVRDIYLYLRQAAPLFENARMASSTTYSECEH